MNSFARLTPSNTKARKAFSSVVEIITQQPERFKYQRSFLEYDPSPVSLESLQSWMQSPGDTSGTGTDAEPEDPPSPEDDVLVFSGSYIFSLQSKLIEPRLGWRAGNGRWTGPSSDVEMLLSYAMPKTRVRGFHARFDFDREYGIFRLNSLHPNTSVTLGTTVFAMDQGPLSLRATTIQIGDLLYDFTFTVRADEEKSFQASKLLYFQQDLGAPPPMEATSATPSENGMTVGPWTVHGAVGTCTFGVVSAASRRDATIEVVALTRFLRQKGGSVKNISREVQAAQRLRSATKGHKYMKNVLQLREIIYQRGRERFDGGLPEYVWLLYTPLNRGTFFTHLLSGGVNLPSIPLRRSLFAQVLQGLVCLHSLGWVHRNIKPANLGIVSLEPPHAVILDFGHACYFGAPDSNYSIDTPDGGIPPQPGRYGTPQYLAPEMEQKHYTTAVDVWAAGLVAHEIFLGSHPFRSISKTGNPWRNDPVHLEQYVQNLPFYKTVVTLLFDKPAESLEKLISMMLLWNPSVRCTAESALSHLSLADAVQNTLQGSKRRREEDDG